LLVVADSDDLIKRKKKGRYVEGWDGVINWWEKK